MRPAKVFLGITPKRRIASHNPKAKNCQIEMIIDSIRKKELQWYIWTL